MNILFLLTNFPGFGGIEKVTTYLASILLKRGLNITIIAYGESAPQLKDNLPEGLNLSYAPVTYGFDSLENVRFIERYLNTHSVDYVVLQDSYAPIESIFDLIDFDWMSKLIVVEHNTPLFAIKTLNSYFYYGQGIRFLIERIIKYPLAIAKAFIQSRKRHRYLLERCYRYVLLSESFKKEIEILCGKKFNDKICSITNPLTISKPSTTISLQNKKKQVLFVGRLTHQKGVRFLLPIWKEFSKCNNEGWQLVILGAGDEKGDALKYIEQEKIMNVRIDAPTTDVASYYEESSILMMTSIYEGFGLVLTEAMSRGCIPIAFDSFSAVRDIIKNGENGLLVKPFDKTEYVEQLNNLISDSKQRDRLALSAISSLDKFSLESVGEKWIQLFNGS